MADMTNDEIRAELDKVENEIEGLRKTAQELRSGLDDAASGPAEPEERAAAIEQAEEQELIIETLEARRDDLKRQLGS
jgi:F0F1-type ATP synthase membrane subunit b/b'